MDPMERLITDALVAAGVAFTTESRNIGRPAQAGDVHLDFHLVDLDIWIEVKQFHSARIARQMATVDNVIVAQGRKAVEALAAMIRAGGLR